MLGKKGESAFMEFLMTYGWAILIVLVAIGALAYFGVLAPDKFLPQNDLTERNQKGINLCNNLRSEDFRGNEIVYPEYQEKIDLIQNNLKKASIYIPESANLKDNKPRIMNTGVKFNPYKITGNLTHIISVFCIIPSESCFLLEEGITGCVPNQDRYEFNYSRWEDWYDG